MEEKIEVMYLSDGFGFLNEDPKVEVNTWEERKRRCLLENKTS